MVRRGTDVTSGAGHRIRLDELVAEGGEGKVYHARNLDTGRDGVAKIYHPQHRTQQTAERLQFLSGSRMQALPAECPVLRPPEEILPDADALGHFGPFFEGRLLEKFLEEPDVHFLQQLQLAAALAHAVSVLHGQGIAHGDLQSRNGIVDRDGSVLRLQLIDFDNFVAAGLPAPNCAGQALYLAPELRDELNEGRPALPTVETELYALGVLIHDILLLRHPSSGQDNTEEEFDRAMRVWSEDPARPGRAVFARRTWGVTRWRSSARTCSDSYAGLCRRTRLGVPRPRNGGGP